ncbi:hypothetical protein GCM10010359_48490 [Streptomyces morookaense]|nr:hypothetical protein GCM10010359_48490 [Streptomyces morookaense]
MAMRKNRGRITASSVPFKSSMPRPADAKHPTARTWHISLYPQPVVGMALAISWLVSGIPHPEYVLHLLGTASMPSGDTAVPLLRISRG